MLDAYIIEKIRREQERSNSERRPPRIEIPTHRDEDPRWRREDEERQPERGVIILDI